MQEPKRKIYKNLPKKFYSPKYKCWVIREEEKDRDWIIYNFLNEDTKEKLETCHSQQGKRKLNERALRYINDPKTF